MMRRSATLALVAALALPGMAAFAAPAGAALSTKYVQSNRQSPVYTYGPCRYRLQMGQYGSAAYIQLKTLNRSCLVRWVQDGNSHLAYGGAKINGAGGRGFAQVVYTARRVGVWQATLPNRRVGVGSYTVCAQLRGAKRCDGASVRLR